METKYLVVMNDRSENGNLEAFLVNRTQKELLETLEDRGFITGILKFHESSIKDISGY